MMGLRELLLQHLYKHQLIGSLAHYLQGLYIPGGCLGFLNHQRYVFFWISSYSSYRYKVSGCQFPWIVNQPHGNFRGQRIIAHLQSLGFRNVKRFLRVSWRWNNFICWIPSKIEWDLTNGPRPVSCDRAIRYSGLGVRSVGPVGDFLDEWLNFGLFFLDLFQVIFFKTLYHGKSPSFATIWENAFWTFFQASKKQIQVFGDGNHAKYEVEV